MIEQAITILYRIAAKYAPRWGGKLNKKLTICVTDRMLHAWNQELSLDDKDHIADSFRLLIVKALHQASFDSRFDEYL